MQSTQKMDPSVLSLPYFPAGHWVQLEAPAFESSPGAQCVHTEAPSREYMPTMQVAHEIAAVVGSE
jgi:hypothetical protein